MTAPENIVSHHEIMQVKRDICFLYHEISEYPTIIGGLGLSSYELPYWNYLYYENRDYEKEFIRDGCLVMILAMAWQQIDGVGGHIGQYIRLCKRYISYLEPDSENTIKLIETVKMALDAAEAGHETEELESRSHWVHVQYVRGYFRDKASSFDTNAYFKTP